MDHNNFSTSIKFFRNLDQDRMPLFTNVSKNKVKGSLQSKKSMFNLSKLKKSKITIQLLLNLIIHKYANTNLFTTTKSKMLLTL